MRHKFITQQSCSAKYIPPHISVSLQLRCTAETLPAGVRRSDSSSMEHSYRFYHNSFQMELKDFSPYDKSDPIWKFGNQDLLKKLHRHFARKDQDSELSVFLLAGSSGLGKTFTAEYCARKYENAILLASVSAYYHKRLAIIQD